MFFRLVGWTEHEGPTTCAPFLVLWFLPLFAVPLIGSLVIILSIFFKNLSGEDEIKNKSSIFRSIKIDNQEIDFSEGFEKLHTLSYEKILSGKGYGIEQSREAIKTTFGIRNLTLTEQPKQFHPYLKKLKRTSK